MSRASSAVLPSQGVEPTLQSAAVAEGQGQLSPSDDLGPASSLPWVARAREGYLSLAHTTTWQTSDNIGPAVPSSHPCGQLTYIRVTSTVMPREGAGPALLNDAADEGRNSSPAVMIPEPGLSGARRKVSHLSIPS